MQVVALIPAFNESDRIVQTIEAALTIRPLDQIVVINDGSTDQTAEIVPKQERVRLLNLQNNQGKGAALNIGLRETQAQVYLLLDGDLGETASLAQRLLDPILNDTADVTIARFEQIQGDSGKKMGFGLVRRLASLGVRLLTGTWVQSPLSGQRAIKAEVVHKLGGFFEGYGVEVGLTVGALRYGYRVLEVPLPMRHRAHGRGLQGIRHRSRQMIHVIKALWRCLGKRWPW